jgi:hypothetical protein
VRYHALQSHHDPIADVRELLRAGDEIIEQLAEVTHPPPDALQTVVRAGAPAFGTHDLGEARGFDTWVVEP